MHTLLILTNYLDPSAARLWGLGRKIEGLTQRLTQNIVASVQQSWKRNLGNVYASGPLCSSRQMGQTLHAPEVPGETAGIQFSYTKYLKGDDKSDSSLVDVAVVFWSGYQDQGPGHHIPGGKRGGSLQIPSIGVRRA